MKGYTFYLSYKTPADKRKGTVKKPGQNSGNVEAVYGDTFFSEGQMCRETIGAVYFHPNSAVCGGAASLEYLRKNCRRIPEELAREIHPVLFERLDQEG